LTFIFERRKSSFIIDKKFRGFLLFISHFAQAAD